MTTRRSLTITLRRESLLMRVLRFPLFPTRDRARAVRSRLTYAPEPDDPNLYTSSLLGILNGLFGVQVKVLHTPGSRGVKGMRD